MRGLIVAVSPENVIGLHGQIPWRHSGDLKRFKEVTMGSAVVMGRLTWESLPGKKPLGGRRNVVITSHAIDGVETYASIERALEALAPHEAAGGDVWFIGGARIYEGAMPFADVLDVTYVPDHVTHPDAVKFPAIDETAWQPAEMVKHEYDPALTWRRFTRRERALS
jgi:dihydrofolate reductase